MLKKITMEDLGYDSFFESNRKKLGLDNFDVARVIVEHREAYKIKNANGEYLAKITGSLMFSASSREDYPAVGDWVAATILDPEHAAIHNILPRKTIIKRKRTNKSRTGGKDEIQIIAANIDVAFIAESIGRDFNLNRFERYFAIASDGGVKPVIILNKIDLISNEELGSKLAEIKNRFNEVEIVPASSVNEEDLRVLQKYIEKGKTYCFLGSSGVGKSSLINKLLGEEIIKTKSINLRSGRGRHVTTARQMYFLANGGIVIDNPGMREVATAVAGAGIDGFFGEITALAQECKFADCTHVNEPGCAVLAALKSGDLDAEKYSNYINLKKQARYYEMSELEKREKDRQFGKFVKKAKQQVKKYKY